MSKRSAANHLPHRLPLIAAALMVLSAGTGCQFDVREGTERTMAGPQIHEIATTAAPEAIGPYSQAVRTSHTLYLSGQIGLDPETGAMVEGGIEDETHRVMQNLQAVLEAAGLGFDAVVQTQVFLADLNDFPVMNEIYASYLVEPHPARATVEVSRLPRDARVEILMTATRQ